MDKFEMWAVMDVLPGMDRSVTDDKDRNVAFWAACCQYHMHNCLRPALLHRGQRDHNWRR